MRRALVASLLVALLAVGAALADPGTDKQRVDDRLGTIESRIRATNEREAVLTGELSALVARERTAQASVAAATDALRRLEGDLGAARTRLAGLDTRIAAQTRVIGVLGGQLAFATHRLERRVRQLYMTDSPDVLTVLVGADSFSDVLDNMDMLRRIGRQDRRIVEDVAGARARMRAARATTQRARAAARETEAQIARQAAEQRATTARLASQRNALAAAASERETTLASIREDRAEFLVEAEGLQVRSAALAAEITRRQEEAARRAAAEEARLAEAEAARQAAAATPAPEAEPPPSDAAASEPASSEPAPSGSGQLRWPVAGAVTSPFGWRFGRMHEGIDIGVSAGTPVAAAGAGTVIYAGWMDGYGNIVVIDHGGGLATAYGHNSSLSVSVGQGVSAGEIVALSGNTGHSTGPHVHFEVRVGGSPADPLGYLY